MKWAASAVWVALVGASCGGIAIVDPPDDDESTTTTGGGGEALCVAACNAIEPCGVDVVDCIARCGQVTPGCESQREPFLTCLADKATDQCTLNTCDDQAQAFITCLSVEAVGGSCGSQGNTCACLHEDEYGNVYDYQCFGSNDFNCTCTLNGTEIGQCSDNSTQPCGFLISCCAPLVFARGFP